MNGGAQATPQTTHFVYLPFTRTEERLYYVDGTNGSDANPGTSAAPWRTVDHAIATLQPADTVIIAAGIYTQTTLNFGPAGLNDHQLTTFRAAPNARVIFTAPGYWPPNVYLQNYVRLDGLWFGGQWDHGATQMGGGFFAGGGPVGRGKQIVNCTIFGYRGGLLSGSSEYLLIQNNRFIHNGYLDNDHAVYLSGGYTAGSLSQHIIVDNNIFVNGDGYAIHGWHNIHSAIITRNFISQSPYGLVLDGADHLVANNFFWKLQWIRWGAIWGYLNGTQAHFRNNIMGHAGASIINHYAPTNTVDLNAFLNTATKGTNPIALTLGQEPTQLGFDPVALDTAIYNLDVAFSQTLPALYADPTIEPLFVSLRHAIPGGSPLYQTGFPWFGAPLNLGPDSPAPTSLEAFWQAFRNLGLRDWDRFGNHN
jgi:hypothetical protein